MTLSTACPKPKPETEAAKRDRRIAQLKKRRGSQKPLPPRSHPVARGAVKRSNPKRKASEFRRAYGSKARVEWVKRQPCPVCLALGMRGDWTAERDNAHIVGGGAGRKADRTMIVPLCRHHHRALHAAGSLSAFYVTFGCKVDLADVAVRTEAAWQTFVGRGGAEAGT